MNVISSNTYILVYFTAAIFFAFLMYLISYAYNRVITRENYTNILYYFFIFIFWLFIVLFCVFRRIDIGVGGTDAIEYKKFFLNAGEPLRVYLHQYKDFEFIYMLSNWLIYRISPNYTFFLMVYYSILIIPLITICKSKIFDRYSFLPLVCLMLFFFTSFNTQRNVLAVFFSYYVIDSLIKKQYKKAVIISILLCGIHITSIVLFLPIIGLTLNDHFGSSKTKFLMLFDVLFSAIFLLGLTFVSTIVSGSRYALYFASNEVSIAGSFVIGLLFIFFISFFDKSNLESNSKICTISYAYLFFAPVVVLQAVFPIAYRMTFFSIPLIYMILDNLHELHTNHYEKIWIITFLFTNIYLIYKIYQFSTQEIFNIMPYYNLLF